MAEQALTLYQQATLESLIDGWLYQKHVSKSGSAKTELAYRTTLQSYRETLQRGGLDLDSQEIAKLAQVAIMWAGMRKPRDDGKPQREGEVSPATYNQRLAIVSSFYTYCQKQAQVYSGGEIVNPIKLAIVERRPVQAYAAAQPFDGEEVAQSLASINTHTLQGKRDYALLAVALSTGRRAAE